MARNTTRQKTRLREKGYTTPVEKNNAQDSLHNQTTLQNVGELTSNDEVTRSSSSTKNNLDLPFGDEQSITPPAAGRGSVSAVSSIDINTANLLMALV